MDNIPEFYVARFSVKQYNLARNSFNSDVNKGGSSAASEIDSINDDDILSILSDSTIRDESTDEENFMVDNADEKVIELKEINCGADVHNTMRIVKDDENDKIKICNYKEIDHSSSIDSMNQKEAVTSKNTPSSTKEYKYDAINNSSKNPDTSDEENGIHDWFQESEDDDASDCDSDYYEPSNRKCTITNKAHGKRLSDSVHLLSRKVIRSREKGKYYACNEPGCGKKFTELSNLNRHKRRHTGEKPYVCDEPGCGKRLTRSSSVTLHKRIHSGEKPYLCDNPGCGKRFTQLGHLTTHKKTHIIGKPYVCHESGCNRRFKVFRSLFYHMRIHNGEDPYVCDEQGCGKRYTHQGSLLSHKKKHKN